MDDDQARRLATAEGERSSSDNDAAVFAYDRAALRRSSPIRPCSCAPSSMVRPHGELIQAKPSGAVALARRGRHWLIVAARGPGCAAEQNLERLDDAVGEALRGTLYNGERGEHRCWSLAH